MSAPKGPRGASSKRAAKPAAAAKKKGPGPDKKGPRPRRRSDGQYVIVGIPGHKPIPLRTTDENEAWRRLGPKLLELQQQASAPIDHLDVRLEAIIREFGDGIDGSFKANLIRHFGEVTLRHLSRDVCWAYEDLRSDETVRSTDAKIKTNTVRLELGYLGTMVNRYGTDRKILVPTVYLPQRVPSKDFVRVREVRRMIEAAVNGWIWDRQTNDWQRLPDKSLVVQPQEWRDEVWAIHRVIVLVINTASRIDTVLRATWSNTGTTPWFDFRVGNFVRRGDEETASRKGRPEVRLLDELQKQLLVWKADDEADGFDNVIHDLDGSPIKSKAWRIFAMVREAAGLDANVTFKTLRASCAVCQMEAGCTPEEAAKMLGNTAPVLSTFYDRYLPEFSCAAADALDSRSYAPERRPDVVKSTGRVLKTKRKGNAELVAKTPRKERSR